MKLGEDTRQPLGASHVVYSVVTSVYRDGHLAHAFCAAVDETFRKYLKTDSISPTVEIILVNDGSPDDSLGHLLATKNAFEFVKIVDLSRNYGQHSALASGFMLARGKFVIRLNIDMQDHPNELPKLLKEMEAGRYDLVVGQYKKRKSPILNRVTAHFYFKLFKFLAGLDVQQRTSPMRVMNRVFIDALNNLTEKSRFPQGLDQWLGFRHKYVEIEHQERAHGKSSYNIFSRLSLASSGILYFSDRPLKLIGYFGLCMALLGFLLGLTIFAQKISGSGLLPGYASIVCIALMAFGIQIGSVGILGLYVGRIFREVQNRPLFIVREIY
ncbi:Putative bactoprenol glucosyl transferase-like protein [Neorhizobium galegae bv. orientalis]|nr:Putative bactoprenol glucosyl transferase-like protein [Neorhizobium galegae bv. orientalis]